MKLIRQHFLLFLLIMTKTAYITGMEEPLSTSKSKVPKKPKLSLTSSLSASLESSRSRSPSPRISTIKKRFSSPRPPKTSPKKNSNNSNEDALIDAIQNNEIIKVQELLTDADININQTNKWGNTALHYASMQKNEKIITLLLRDFRTDASLKNSQNFTARDCFIKEPNNEKDEQIRIALFVRAMLNIVVNEESFAVHVNQEYDIEEAIATIKRRIARNYEYQQDYQQLPQDQLNDPNKELSDNNYLPSYITNDFIKNMILQKIGSIKNNIDMKYITQNTH